MKSKLLAISLAITLLITIFSMNLGAVAPYSDYYGRINLAANSAELSGLPNNYPKQILLNGYNGYVYVDFSYLDHTIEIKALLNNQSGGYNWNLRVTCQTVIEYSDGTYDMYSLYGSNHSGYISELTTYYPASGKTVSFIDVEFHFFVEDTYLDTLNIRG